jgi:hypothetical protein
MQNREELRQKGLNRSTKMMYRKREKILFFERGAGISIIFGLKYRPLGYPNNMQRSYILFAGRLGTHILLRT